MSEAQVHPTAVVADGARLGRGTVVDACAVISCDVELGEDCWVGPHACLYGKLRAGDRNQFFPHCSIGAVSQDLWHPEEESWVVMGDDNVVRENVTINRGTSKEYLCTSIGSGNNIMAGCHVAHDCVLGNQVVLANNVLLGGHVRIRDNASIGGGAGVHHFVTIGRRAFVGGLTRCIHDVPPWMLYEGHPARIKAVNVVGARRHGLGDDSIKALRDSCKRLFLSDGEARRTDTRRRLRKEMSIVPEVQQVLDFLDLQASGSKGRHLERYRQEDGTLDTDAVPAVDRPPEVP